MSKKKSASVSALEQLHAAVATYMTQRLEASAVDDEDDDDFVIPLSTGEVANMIKFLKDNNISAAPTDETVAGLASEFESDIEAQRIAKANAITSATAEEREQADWFH